MQRRFPHTPSAVPRTSTLASAQTCFPQHGGRTGAAPVSARDECPRPCAVSGLQARFPNHGGLTPAALASVRLCIEKIVFRRQTFATQPRAGGVSPPWEPCTRAQRLKITQSRRWYRSQPFAAPLSANAPAIGTHTFGGPPNKHACVCAGALPTPTAGSRPPLLFPHETSVPERVRYRCCRRVSLTTAG
jgi:hypothetical protein